VKISEIISTSDLDLDLGVGRCARAFCAAMLIFNARVLHMFSHQFFRKGLAHLSNHVQKIRAAFFHE